MLKFDFYLPVFNMCIEFDGEQHYRPHRDNDKFNHSMISLRDQIKTLYCEANNIKL